MIGLPLLTVSLVARARRSHAGVGAAAVPAAGRRDRGDRRAAARDRDRGRRVPVRQLLLHAAAAPVHDRTARERARADRVPRRRGCRELRSSTRPRGERATRRGRAPTRRRSRGSRPTCSRTIRSPTSWCSCGRRSGSTARACSPRTDGAVAHRSRRPGPRPPASPDDADLTLPLGDDVVLALVGGRLTGADRQVLNAFAAQLTAARERARLSEAAAQATELTQANELRTALLQAVSHDLRTPLASIKASASSLRQTDIEWSEQDEAEFLADDRGGDRPAHRARVEPARHEPSASRRAAADAAAREPRRGRARRDREPRRAGVRRRVRRARDAQPGARRRRAARAGRRQPRGERDALVARRSTRRASPPVGCTTASTCA